jgi:hypothetical protein
MKNKQVTKFILLSYNFKIIGFTQGRNNNYHLFSYKKFDVEFTNKNVCRFVYYINDMYLTPVKKVVIIESEEHLKELFFSITRKQLIKKQI